MSDQGAPGAAPDRAGNDPISAVVAPGYQFQGEALELGGPMTDATTLVDVPIRIPLGMLNRHGLVAGATGTRWSPPPRSSRSPGRSCAASSRPPAADPGRVLGLAENTAT